MNSLSPLLHDPTKKTKPSHSVIKRLAIKYEHTASQQAYYGCIASDRKCYWKCSGNAQVDRILAHASRSIKLTKEESRFAAQNSANLSTGQQLEEFEVQQAENAGTGPSSKEAKFLVDVTGAGQAELTL